MTLAREDIKLLPTGRIGGKISSKGTSLYESLLWHIVCMNMCGKVWVVMSGLNRLLMKTLTDESTVILSVYVICMCLGTFWYTYLWSSRGKIRNFFEIGRNHPLSCVPASLITFSACLYYVFFSYAFYKLNYDDYAFMMTLFVWNAFIAFLLFVVTVCFFLNI